MRLKDTGLTAAELKAQVKKYMIETYERMDFVADRAEGIYTTRTISPTWTSMQVSLLTAWATATPRWSRPFRSSPL